MSVDNCAKLGYNEKLNYRRQLKCLRISNTNLTEKSWIAFWGLAYYAISQEGSISNVREYESI